MDNQVNKLRIISMKDPRDQFKGGLSVGKVVKAVASVLTSTIFEVQVNPEQIARSFKIKNQDTNQSGGDNSNSQFTRVEPEILDLKFTIDGTGALQNNGLVTADPVNALQSILPSEAAGAYVPAKIAQLLAIAYQFVDESHRPPFVTVNWGKLVFMGVLEEMTHTYNLFSPAGIPLRAEVNIKLKAYKEPVGKNAILSFLSPDLTRLHKVKAGDTILTITQEVYENQRYYLEVAKANKLTNFRKLANSTNLQLPPVDKTKKQ